MKKGLLLLLGAACLASLLSLLLSASHQQSADPQTSNVISTGSPIDLSADDDGPPSPPGSGDGDTNSYPPGTNTYQPLVIGTNFDLLSSITMTASGTDTICTVEATNTVLYDGYEIIEATNLLGPWFPLPATLWMGAGGDAVQTEYVTNSQSMPNVFIGAMDATLIVTNPSGTYIGSGGQSGGCPGLYGGYAVYSRTIAGGWGYQPDTNAPFQVVSDGTGVTNTHIEVLGAAGDEWCDQTSCMVGKVHGTNYSPVYEVTVYFPPGTTNIPANYPVKFVGFITNIYVIP